MAENLENSLNQINAKYVKLSEDAVKKNNDRLKQVLNRVTEELKRINPLFKALFKRSPYYGGSYYDNLKVSKPNEYDIGVLLDLPKLSVPELKPSKKCGYVNVKISLDQINKQEYLKEFRGLSKLIDAENYLSVSAVNQWFEALVQKALNNINDNKIKTRKSGPAITLRVFDDYNDYFDVDLVPFFFFEKSYWPVGYKTHNSNSGFFIVPKLLKDGDVRKWRATFQYQEKEIIKDVGRVKPAIRLIKVLRDKENFTNLKSYFIKTVAMWEVETTAQQNEYSNKTLSETFIKFMEKLIESIENGRINYIWHKEYNLLEDWSDIHFENVSKRFKNILKKIKENPVNVWKYYGSADLPPIAGLTIQGSSPNGGNNNDSPSFSPIERILQGPPSTRGRSNEGQETLDSRSNALLTAGGVIAGLGALAIAGFTAYKLTQKRNE